MDRGDAVVTRVMDSISPCRGTRSRGELGVLDAAHQRLLREEAAAAIPPLVKGLARLRARMNAEEWRQFSETTSRQHPLHAVLQEDPLTARAFRKPRGYAGDAVTLDFMYAGLPGDLGAAISPLGRKLFEQTAMLSGTANAVRERRNLLAAAIDRTEARVTRPRILSVACGHLREALWSRAVGAGEVGEFIAFDQDRESLETVERDVGRFGVSPAHGSVRDLLGGADLGTFDLIYSAGLYDYLNDKVARDLTRILAGAVRPGGELIVANFVRDFAPRAYMECFMDWRLICRSESELSDLSSELDDFEARTFCDQSGYVAYLSLRRGDSC